MSAMLKMFTFCNKITFQRLTISFFIAWRPVLELGPFQGEVACYTIKKERGVCGKAWKDKQIVVVPNFVVNTLAALAAYCFFPKKPSIAVERSIDRQLTLF